MRHKILFLSSLLLSLNLISCSYLQKIKDRFQNRPSIEGEGIENIIHSDIDSDAQGSDSGSIEGLNTVYFDLNAFHLTGSVKEALEANKAWLDKNSKVKRIILEGHCDHLGSEAYNIGLGERRAQSVMNYLKSLGVSANKMSIVSYGEERPISQTDNALNRRVNFVPQY